MECASNIPAHEPDGPFFHPEDLIPRFPRLGIFDDVHCFLYHEYSIIFTWHKDIGKRLLILSIFDSQGGHTSPMPKTELKGLLAYFDFHLKAPIAQWERTNNNTGKSPVNKDDNNSTGNTLCYAQEQKVYGVN